MKKYNLIAIVSCMFIIASCSNVSNNSGDSIINKDSSFVSESSECDKISSQDSSLSSENSSEMKLDSQSSSIDSAIEESTSEEKESSFEASRDGEMPWL